jgi:protein TonB
MAYADQKLSGNRLTAIIIVALIHIVVGYALVSGLAYSAAQKIMKK